MLNIHFIGRILSALGDPQLNYFFLFPLLPFLSEVEIDILVLNSVISKSFQTYNLRKFLFSAGCLAKYSAMLLKGAIPDPLAIMTMGLPSGI